MKNLSKNSGKIVLALCEIAVGVLLFIDPSGLTGTIIRIAGVLLALSGIVSAIHYFLDDPVEAHLGQGLAKALCSLIVGLFCVFKADWFLETFKVITIFYGAVILFTGIVRVQWAVDMIRMKTGRWYVPGIGALVSIVFGVIAIMNPFATMDLCMKFVAVSMVVDAVIDIASVIFGRTSAEPDHQE